MNYQKLIEVLQDENNCNVLDYIEDAATAIKTLLMERNAAVEELRGECHACKHNAGWHNVGMCLTCTHETAKGITDSEKRIDCWEWQGPKKDDQ